MFGMEDTFESNYDYQSENILDLLTKMDSLIKLLESNLNSEPGPELHEPKLNMMELEMIINPSFEDSEFDYKDRSVVSLKTGYAGAMLQCGSVKLNGNVAHGARIIAKEGVFCQNCFGAVEAKNIVANNIGTLHNQKVDKNRMNIIAKDTLIVKGKTYFAFVDAWNARFDDLIRNSQIIIGRMGIFHNVGSGTNIELSPIKSSFFDQITEAKAHFKKKFEEIKKERDTIYNEVVSLRIKSSRMNKVETDNIPTALRDRIEDNIKTYDEASARLNDIEGFFVKRVYEDKILKIDELNKQLISRSLENCVLFFPGKIEPFVNIQIRDKSLYIGEPTRNIKVYYKDNAIIVEPLPENDEDEDSEEEEDD
jgi:hypothetical protein